MRHITASSFSLFFSSCLRLSVLLTAKAPLYPLLSLLHLSSRLIVLGDFPIENRNTFLCKSFSLQCLYLVSLFISQLLVYHVVLFECRSSRKRCILAAGSIFSHSKRWSRQSGNDLLRYAHEVIAHFSGSALVAGCAPLKTLHLLYEPRFCPNTSTNSTISMLQMRNQDS